MNSKLVNYGFVSALAVSLLSGCGGGKEAELLAQGKLTYDGTCKVCHAQGLNGAPILGNKKMWASRATQGEDVLVTHAMNGFGLMPAKGGKEQLTEAEIRPAVKYMLSTLAP